MDWRKACLEKKYRGTNGGMLLVKAAMELVKKKDAGIFMPRSKDRIYSFLKGLDGSRSVHYLPIKAASIL